MVTWEHISSRRRYPWIAREGWSYLVTVVAAGLVLYLWLGLWAMLVVVPAVATVIFLLRDPPLSIPCSPLALVSPVEGSVINVQTGVRDPWLEHREAVCIRIRVSLLDVFSVRSTTEGKVQEQWCSKIPGEARTRNSDGPPKDRSFQYAFWTCTDEEDHLVTAVSAPCLPLLHRLRVNLHTGDRVGQGHRIGFLFLGGEVEVWAPPNVTTEVSPGDRVHSGSSILAHLVHRKPVNIAVNG